MSCIDLTNGAIMPGATLPDMFKSHLSSSSDFLKLAEFMHSRYTQYLIATLKGDTRISDIVSGWQHAQREFQSERTNLERELQKLRTDNQSLSQIKSSFTEMEHSNTLLKRQVRELEQLLVTTQQVAEAAKNTREIVASASLSIDVDSYSPTRTHSPSNPASSRSPVTTTGKSRKRSEANVASPVAGDSQVPPDKRAKRTEVRATEKVQETDALQDLIYGERDYMDPKIERPKSVMPVDPTQVQSMPQTATPSNAQELLQSIQHITSQPSIPAIHTSPTPGQLIPNFTSPAKSTGDSSAQNMTLANLAQFNSDLPTLLGASGSNPGPSTSASLAPLPGLANGQDRLTAMDDQKLLDQLLNTSTGQAGGVQIPCNSRTIRSATGGTKYKEKYCKICGVFMTNEHNHMKIHSDERPFKCKLCLKDFKRRDVVRGHLRNMHKKVYDSNKSDLEDFVIFANAV